MPALKVRGGASGRELGPWPVENTEEKLMSFLQGHGLPVASSCDGEGVCRKCVVNGELLSCQVTVGEFLRLHPDGTVVLSYV